MAIIGTFTKTGANEFTGTIATLSVQINDVRIIPDTPRTTSDSAPSRRVMFGDAELGAAWSKRSTEGRNYLSLKLDDLFDDEGGGPTEFPPRPGGNAGA